MVALWKADLSTAYESPLLLMAFNFLFSTAASLLVVVLLGRSYVVRGSPGMLLLGCGVAIWGAAGTLVPVLFPHGTNALISGHNSLVWFSALCNLVGAVLSLRPWRQPRVAGLTLAIAYAAALCLVWLIAMLAVEGWMPEFFVQGQGGTPLRTFVLGSAILMFALTAAVLWRANRLSPSAFVRWYGAALLLVAIGLLGIMMETVHGGALSWTGRAAQFLGGAYMLMAAIASVRETRTWEVPLTAALSEAKQQYRTLFETMTEGFAMHEIITDTQGRPCDYRFLDVNPAFERLTGLKRADLVGKRVLEVLPNTEPHWIDNYGSVVLTGKPLHMENYSAGLGRWYDVLAYRTAPQQFAVVFSDITQRKRAEESLRESHNRFTVLTQNIDAGVALIDERGKFAVVNPAFLRLFDLPSESSIRNVNDRDWGQWQVLTETGELLDVDEHPVRKAVMTGKAVRSHLVAVKPPSQASPKWMQISAEPILTVDGRMEAVICTYHDVTARRQAEESLGQSEQRHRLLAETMLQGVVNYDLDGKIIAMNPAAERILGKTREELRGSTPVQEEHDTIRENGEPFPGIEHPGMVALRTGQPARGVIMGAFNPKIGEYRWISIDAVPLCHPGQTRPSEVYTVFEDITDRKRAEDAQRKRAEDALRMSEQEFRSLAEAMPQIVWATRPDGWNIYFNQQWVDYTGLTMEESYGHGWNKPFHPDDKQRAWVAWQRATRYNEPYSLECRLQRADGVYRWWLVRGSPMLGPDGEILKWFGTCTDIEEIKRAESALREANDLLEQRVAERTAAFQESERLYRAIGESIDYGIWVCDAHGRNTYASQSFLKLVGLTQAQCSDTGWGDVLHPDDVEATIAAWKQCVQSGGPWYREHRFRGADGQWHPILACGVAVRNERNEVTAWAGINLDISRLKQTEDALRESVKELERSNKELEQFAYISSHDLQEPLRQVVGFGNLLSQRYSDRLDDRAKQYISFMAEGSRRMSNLVRALLDYSRVGRPGQDVEPVSAEDALNAALLNLKAAAEECEARVTREKLPTVLAHQVELSQIFQNLMGNAMKFRREGVKPEVHVGCRRDGQTCTFWVKDNGIGIAPELHEKAFTVFQRLHGQGKYPGTGIGLAICRKIVERHGGRIWIESAVGEGATFFFTLPLAKEIYE